MKKVLTVAALIGAISFAGIQAVSAHGGRGYNSDYGNDYCGSYNSEDRATTDQDLAGIEKFRDDTSASLSIFLIYDEYACDFWFHKLNPIEIWVKFKIWF